MIPCPTATGIGILYSFDKVVPQADIFVVQLGHWITAFFSMTFATNVICTGAYRLPGVQTEHSDNNEITSNIDNTFIALVAYRIWAQ